MDLRTLLRVVGDSPKIVELANLAKQAAGGDEDARRYLKEHGVWQAMEIVRPGAGHAARSVMEAYHQAKPETIEGEYRVITDPDPWERVVSWLKRQRWGTYAIIGPKGQGKTMLAMRMAEVWHRETGWPVEAVNIYPEDRYPFVQPVPTARFLNRIRAIVRLLNPPEPDENGGTATESQPPMTPEEIDAALEKYRRRVVVIDEMSLMVGASGVDAGRIAVRQIMAQARHLSWLIVYVGQLCRMFPADLLNCEAVFVKEPTGREVIVDRDDALTQDLWTRATDAFASVRREARWADYPDVRAWCYVDSPSCGAHGYMGLMPFSMPTTRPCGRVTLENESQEGQTNG